MKEIPSGSWWFLTEEDPPSDHFALKQFAAPSKQAFLWFHFPKANFTIEACKAFNTEVLLFDKSAVKGASVFDIARIEAQSQELLEGYTSYQSFEMPLTYPMVTSSTVNLHFAVTSGTERMKSLGPTLERQGQVGLLVFFQGECGEMRSIESLKAFESVFGLVVAHFKPTYGFGFRGFNRFVEIYRTMGNAEDRVWPWNVWDLSANPTFLIRNLERFSSANKRDWALTVIDDRFATLMARNSTLMDTNVDASITKAVLVKRLFG